MTSFSISDTALLASLILLAAALYSSVGHAGASGYLAAMALFGLSPDIMKPTALVLNILVAIIGSVRFYRAGYFDWATFWPFAVTSIPAAFVGGKLMLPSEVYKKVIGAVLIYTAARTFHKTAQPQQANSTQLPLLLLALPTGACLGFFSGLVGVGGGIFLSPLLLLMNWADMRRTAGISAVFILVNSMAGLAGQLSRVPTLPSTVVWLGLAAIVGGYIGSTLGSTKLDPAILRRILSIVLLIAAGKMMLT